MRSRISLLYLLVHAVEDFTTLLTGSCGPGFHYFTYWFMCLRNSLLTGSCGRGFHYFTYWFMCLRNSLLTGSCGPGFHYFTYWFMRSKISLLNLLVHAVEDFTTLLTGSCGRGFHYLLVHAVEDFTTYWFMRSRISLLYLLVHAVEDFTTLLTGSCSWGFHYFTYWFMRSRISLLAATCCSISAIIGSMKNCQWNVKESGQRTVVLNCCKKIVFFFKCHTLIKQCKQLYQLQAYISQFRITRSSVVFLNIYKKTFHIISTKCSACS